MEVNKVILVHIDFVSNHNEKQQHLEEFIELATSAGFEVASVISCRREHPDPKYFVGSGKAEEIRAAVLSCKANIVLFNHFLSPTQERNLEKILLCKVLDRSGLILDIFAKRARSFEGKLQVELAQLEYLATRLVGGWTHLERQRGGIGLRGGPGETQLEVDRRLLREKVISLKERLAKFARQRSQNRRARKRSAIPTIALVGYTNAGKSSLFNLLASEQIYVADKLFATLDPTLRRIILPGFGEVIIVDTVGFIRDLPHELIEAFHATLEETKEADLLLHVIDASDPQKNDKIAVVNSVLAEIGVAGIPQLQVLNKIDRCDGIEPGIAKDTNELPSKVWISATNKLGLESLLEAITKIVGAELEEISVTLLPTQSQARAALYQDHAVLAETIDTDGNSHLKLRINPRKLKDLL